MRRILVQVPDSVKVQLDALRAEGITASGLIRRLLNQYFAEPETHSARVRIKSRNDAPAASSHCKRA